MISRQLFQSLLGRVVALEAASGGVSLADNYLQSLKSGAQVTTGSFVDLTGWASPSSFGSSFSFNTTTGELTVNYTGLVSLNAHVMAVSTSNARTSLQIKFQLDGGGGYSDVAGSLDSQYIRRNGANPKGSAQINNFILSVSSGDVLKTQIQDLDAAATINSDEARITVRRL